MRRAWWRMAMALGAVALAVLGALIDSRPAYACSCQPITTIEAVRRADAAFRGTVVAAEPTGRRDGDWVDLRFDVQVVYKGEVFREQVVASAANSAACGLEPEIGSSWVIFAVQTVQGDGDRTVSRLTTDLCSGNLPAAAAPSSLGSGRPPRAGASDTEEKAVRADDRVSRGLVIAGVGALAVAGLAAVGLGLLWGPGRRR